MVYILINGFAIIVATLAGLAAGSLYYIVVDQAGANLRAVGHARLWKLAAVTFFAQCWLASILAGALILAPAEADPTVMALSSAAVIWIGFVAPVIIVTHYYRGLSFRTAALDVVYWLLVMLVQAVVLFSIGLSAPPA